MRIAAAIVFSVGLLLVVRVMFFGVRRRVGAQQFAHRSSPLAVAAALAAAGALLYARTALGHVVTTGWTAGVVLVSVLAGFGAWWLVRLSAAAPLSDPADDPRYRFQGHVARIVSTIEGESDAAGSGRIAFVVDGQRVELRARWLPGNSVSPRLGSVDSEVVIERVDGDVAYVEPWTLVEGRL